MKIGDLVTIIGDEVGIVVGLCSLNVHAEIWWSDGVKSWETIDDLEVL